MRRHLPALLLTILALLSTLTGCAAGGKAATSPVDITIDIKGTKVTPHGTVYPVKVGTPVTLHITTDRETVVHAHGFQEIAVKPGEPAQTTLTPTQPGRYEIETHDPAIIIAFLDIE